MALGKGHPVLDAGGEHVGKVSRVIADEERDIFSGIAFRSRLLDPERFAPASVVDAITSESVRLTISAAEAEQLEPYDG
jgi:hypothetical protein